MRIEITKFKFYDQYTEYEFEEEKLNLLTGPSNSGKTTIFEAIYWCLYGSKKTVCPKGIKPTNEYPTIVKLILDSDIEITRTKPPDILEVSLANGTELDEESAQEWINQNFGTKSVFLATTYMKQGKQHPILELKNPEKMELLRELTFGKNSDENSNEDPNFYSERVNEEIKEVKNEILRISGRISVLEEQYEVQRKSNKKNEVIWRKSEIELSKEAVDELINKNKEKEKSIVSLRKQVSKSRKEWEIYRVNVKRKENLTSRLETVEQQKTDIRYTKNILRQQLERLESKKQYEIQKSQISSIKPSNEACNFLDRYFSHLDEIQEVLESEEEYLRVKKLLNLELDDESKLEQLKLQTRELIKQYEEQESVYQKYLTNVKTYELQKKQYDNWNKRKINIQKSKEEYDSFYENEDLQAILFLINSDTTIPIKKALSNYYTSKSRFSKVLEILQKIVYDAEMSESLLICPKCSTSLEIVKHKKKAELVEYSGKSIDEKIKSIAEKGIDAVNQLDELYKHYQQLKDSLEDEPFVPSPIEEYNSSKNITKKQVEEARKIHHIINNDLIRPDYEIFNSLALHNYTRENIRKYIKEGAKYTLYKKSVENLRKLENFEEPIEDLTQKETQEWLNMISNLESQRSTINEELKGLQELSKPEINPDDLESQIRQLEEEIKAVVKLIEAGTRLLEVQKIKEDLQTDTDNIENTTKRHSNLDKIKQIISETSSHALEETVETINSILQDITAIIYDNDTHITVSMFKEFKTKDYVKPQPCVKITRGFGDEELVYDVDELCGGEKSRLSLALTLAFSTIGTTPFLFIDEGMSSMDSVLIDKCIKVIKNHVPNKTIINVCHSINEGIHDTKIEIETDG